MTVHNSYEIGAVHGRFQGLHLGHAEYILTAKQRCERLLVGITSPNRQALHSSEGDDHRSLAEHNPFSFYERQEMIRSCLVEAGHGPSEFTVVPFPIEQPAYLTEYLPSPIDVVQFVTIYDQWGRYKKELLKQLGFAVEVLWERSDETRVASGTEVRRRMRYGEDFSDLVSPGVQATMIRLGLPERLLLRGVKHEVG